MSEPMAAENAMPPEALTGATAEPETKASLFRQIPQSDKIPFLQKLAFASGGNLTFLAKGMTTGILMMPFFNIGLGINPVSLGVLLMVLQAVNFFFDPVMGNITDNARTRWGRRRPFMVPGAILTTCLYLMIWRPPSGLGETGMLIYLLAIGVPFFMACSLWGTPFGAMSMELTPNYDERTRLAAWGALFGKLFGLLGGWSMAIVTCPLFVSAKTGKPDILNGIQIFSLFVGGLILVLGLLPAIAGRERYYKAEVVKQAKEPLWQGLKESAHCGPQWIMIGISVFLVISSGSISTLGQYVNIYLVNGGRIADASVVTGWKASLIVATGIACIPFWTWLGEKFEKKTIITIMVSLSMVGHLLYFFCLRPDHPFYQLIPACFEVGAISAAYLFFPSMFADIVDYDELNTNRRREGSLGAFAGLFTNVGGTVAMGLGGVLLQLTGFSSKLETQPPAVLHRMLFIFIAVPIAGYLLTLVTLQFYPLTRRRMEEIRAQLEERRGKV